MGNNNSLIKKDEIVEWYLKNARDGYKLYGRTALKEQGKGQDLEEILGKNGEIGTLGASSCNNCLHITDVRASDTGNDFYFSFTNGKSLNYQRPLNGWGLRAPSSTLIDLALVQVNDPQSRVVLNKLKALAVGDSTHDPDSFFSSGSKKSSGNSVVTLGDIKLSFGGGQIENPETGRMVHVGGRIGQKIIKQHGGGFKCTRR